MLGVKGMSADDCKGEGALGVGARGLPSEASNEEELSTNSALLAAWMRFYCFSNAPHPGRVLTTSV